MALVRDDSGAGGLKNPGFSVNAFVLLAKLFRATTPIDLARTVQIASILALVLLWLFAAVAIPRARREPWLWALALACVNPFEVLLERKIWAPSLFPLLCMAMLAGWWYRTTVVGAFAWGLSGALAGQLEMAGGLFMALAFVVATRGRHVRVAAWLAGSELGATPLLPWLGYMRQQLRRGLRSGSHDFYVTFSMAHHPLSSWMDRYPEQFWWVWLTGIAGMGLDYSYYADVWKLVRQPLSRRRGATRLLLGALVVFNAALTTSVLLDVHAGGGVPHGDFGRSYEAAHPTSPPRKPR